MVISQKKADKQSQWESCIEIGPINKTGITTAIRLKSGSGTQWIARKRQNSIARGLVPMTI
jgi:hypothetical protein